MSDGKLNLSDLRALVEMLTKKDIQELEMKSSQYSVKIRTQPSSVFPPQRETMISDYTCHLSPDDATLTVITSYSPGVFLTRHPSENGDLVEVGSYVLKEQLLGLLKVGPIYLPIKSSCDGYVKQVHAEMGDLVGYGSKLFSINQ